MTTLAPHRLLAEQQDALKREEFLKDVLITAVEGGTGYWAQVSAYFPDEGRVALHEFDDDGISATHKVTLGTIELGIKTIIEQRSLVNRQIREDVIIDSIENEMGRGDADTADCIVQAGLFGSVVYGYEDAVDHVRQAARANPGTNWEPIEIGFAGPNQGVMLFDRPDFPIYEGIERRPYGTVEFGLVDGGKVNFFWGHYDLSHDDAWTDYEKRLRRG
jgi:hypothetical protein